MDPKSCAADRVPPLVERNNAVTVCAVAAGPEPGRARIRQVGIRVSRIAGNSAAVQPGAALHQKAPRARPGCSRACEGGPRPGVARTGPRLSLPRETPLTRRSAQWPERAAEPARSGNERAIAQKTHCFGTALSAQRTHSNANVGGHGVSPDSAAASPTDCAALARRAPSHPTAELKPGGPDSKSTRQRARCARSLRCSAQR